MLMHVTGTVDSFESVCPPDSKIKYSVFYVYLCSCIILCVVLLASLMQSKGKFLCYS